MLWEDDVFIWYPREDDLLWIIKINDVDVTDDIQSANFIKAATGEIGSCEISLYNANHEYDYSKGQTIKLYMDYNDASTLKWSGFVQRVEEQDEPDAILLIRGEHVATDLLDITINESYVNQAIEDILEDLFTKYASSFTYNKITFPCSTTTTVTWSRNPLWSCILDLCGIVNYDTYVDDSKELHFFERGSIMNEDEAIVRNDTLVEVRNLGSSSVEVKNKIMVYGEDSEGLEIVATAEDTASQAIYGIKELVIQDSNIATYADALARAEGELTIYKDAANKGTTTSDVLADINPGDKIWVSVPEQKIHMRFIILKFTHAFPQEESKIEFMSLTEIPKVFGARIEQELALKKIVNPYKLNQSFNFTFDDNSEIATNIDCVTINGSLKLSMGKSTGTVTSIARSSSNNISEIQLKYAGKDLDNSRFYFSVDNGTTWEEIIKEEYKVPIASGKWLKLKVELNSDSIHTNPELGSCVLLYS